MKKYNWRITISEPVDEEIRKECIIQNKTKAEALAIIREICKEYNLIITETRRIR